MLIVDGRVLKGEEFWNYMVAQIEDLRSGCGNQGETIIQKSPLTEKYFGILRELISREEAARCAQGNVLI